MFRICDPWVGLKLGGSNRPHILYISQSLKPKNQRLSQYVFLTFVAVTKLSRATRADPAMNASVNTRFDRP